MGSMDWDKTPTWGCLGLALIRGSKQCHDTTYAVWVGTVPGDDKSTEMYRGQVFEASVLQT